MQLSKQPQPKPDQAPDTSLDEQLARSLQAQEDQTAATPATPGLLAQAAASAAREAPIAVDPRIGGTVVSLPGNESPAAV